MIRVTLKNGHKAHVFLAESFREKIGDDETLFHQSLLTPDTEIVDERVPMEDYRIAGELLQSRDNYDKRHFHGHLTANSLHRLTMEFHIDMIITEIGQSVWQIEIVNMTASGTVDRYIVETLNYTLAMIINGNARTTCLPFVPHFIMTP